VQPMAMSPIGLGISFTALKDVMPQLFTLGNPPGLESKLCGKRFSPQF